MHAAFYVWRWPGNAHSRLGTDLSLAFKGPLEMSTPSTIWCPSPSYTTLDNKRQYLRLCGSSPSSHHHGVRQAGHHQCAGRDPAG
jgi:hypothetical protein